MNFILPNIYTLLYYLGGGQLVYERKKSEAASNKVNCFHSFSLPFYETLFFRLVSDLPINYPVYPTFKNREGES